MDKMEKTLNSMISREEFKDLQNDVRECASRYDLAIVESAIAKEKKDLGGLMRTEEFVNKMSVILAELEGKIIDRPTEK